MRPQGRQPLARSARGCRVLLSQARVGGKDDVWFGCRNSLEVDAIGLVEKHRRFCTELSQLVFNPWHDAVTDVIAPCRLRHAHWDDAKGKRNLVVHPRDGRDALWRFLDGCGAVCMLDGHGESVITCNGSRCGRRT